jgi:hypothetical protein
MTIELRTVFDTGVVVSAVLLPQSIPRQAFDLAAGKGLLLASEATIEEMDAVLRRPGVGNGSELFSNPIDACGEMPHRQFPLMLNHVRSIQAALVSMAQGHCSSKLLGRQLPWPL